jgi:hypothetical protein
MLFGISERTAEIGDRLIANQFSNFSGVTRYSGIARLSLLSFSDLEREF